MFTLGIDAFSSRSQRSGVEWYTYHLLRAMQPITPEDWRVFLYSLDQTSNIKSQTSEQWEWKQLRWPPRRGWGQVRLSWEMLRRPPNVLFVPAAMIPFVHPHRPWRKQWTVSMIPDVAFLDHPELYAPRERLRQETALQFALHHAEKIFVPSEATRDQLAASAKPDQLVVTPLGVDHARYQTKPDESDARIKEKYHLREPYLLYVGRVDAKKNLSVLIRAFASCQLVVVGSLGFGASEIIKQASDRVRLLGYIPEEDLPALYRSAQAFVFPSAAEGFGLPVLQALACGTPTVASDIPALREVAGDAALFASPTDEAAWVAAFDRIITDTTLHNTLRARGVLRAASFSWDACAKKTWQVIEDLVQSSH